MTDQQQKETVNELIPEIKRLLAEAEIQEKGEDALSRLLEIKELISYKAPTKLIPQEWIGAHFGPGGLKNNAHTAAAAAYVEDYDESEKYSFRRVLERAAFISREREKHTEEEMLEWLCANECRRASELLIVVSRAPCQKCLQQILAFLEERKKRLPAIKCRIGFYHWSRDTSLRQMYESIYCVEGDSLDVEYQMLTMENIRTGVFSCFFTPPHTNRLAALEEEGEREKQVYDDAMDCAFEEAKIQDPNADFSVGKFFRKQTPEELKQEAFYRKVNSPELRKKRAEDMMLKVFGKERTFM